MKQAVFIGNCQAAAIQQCLKYSNFYEKYTSKYYANWQMIESKSAPPITDLANADLVVYQPLSDVHGCYSTNPHNPKSMLSVCKSDAVLVSFPRIHNNSIWPIFKKHRYKSFYYGDEFLKYYMDKGVTKIEDFLRLYDSNELNFFFNERYERNKKISVERELETDIKVWDFLESNWHNKQLFLTQDHPTTHVFSHVVKQLCDIIDVELYFDLELLGKNFAGLPDSTYDFASNELPLSNYSIVGHNFNWTTEMNEPFYKNELVNYCKMVGLN